ncbi:MAG: hypothetical protein V4699_01955 [Patescibacteria group bacterium]
MKPPIGTIGVTSANIDLTMDTPRAHTGHIKASGTLETGVAGKAIVANVGTDNKA